MVGPDEDKSKGTWDAGTVRALRQHLGLAQRQLAEYLGTRQQTISEWETGLHRPRGASVTLLKIIAERAAFYSAADGEDKPSPKDDGAPLERK
ncbi:MAG: helix-turn-helix domain-containing protein [Dehalococcoidia bacterium]